MHVETLKSVYKNHKEKELFGRYINSTHILPVLKKLNTTFEINEVGVSVKETPIYSIKVGVGDKKVFMWSQMHGNESTTTKAIFDLLNTFKSKDESVDSIFNCCTLLIIPMLNPDGAAAYTRLNANNVDLNRDAQDLTQPESKVLRKVFNSFKPNYCYNLHGQRTIFGTGDSNNSATVSFLAPAQDNACAITPTRKIAMEIISKMNDSLQSQIPNQIGTYDDAFNINCVGDTFQSENVPTILFEAGHFTNDYDREVVRELIFQSYIVSLNYIATSDIDGSNFEQYLLIDQNQQTFFDIIIRHAKISSSDEETIDIGILYREVLINNAIEFLPKVEKISNLKNYFAHKIIDASNGVVETINSEILKEGYENDFVLINSEQFSLKAK